MASPITYSLGLKEEACLQSMSPSRKPGWQRALVAMLAPLNMAEHEKRGPLGCLPDLTTAWMPLTSVSTPSSRCASQDVRFLHLLFFLSVNKAPPTQRLSSPAILHR